MKQSNSKKVVGHDHGVQVSPEWTVVGFWFKTVLETASQLGLDQRELLKASGLNSSVVANPERHYPLSDLLSLFRLVCQRSGEEDIGIRYIQNCHPCAMGVIGRAVQSASTLREAWETVIRYRHLMLNVGSTRFFDHGDTVCMRWYPYSRDIVVERYFVDAVVSGWMINSQLITGRRIVPVSVSLTYPKTAESDLFVSTYGDQVSFEQTYNSVVFRREDMESPLLYADKKVFRILCDQAEQDVAQFRSECPFSEKLEYQLRQQFPNGDVSIQAIAELMHISVRTLQRRLMRESTSFNQILTNIRHELALVYLQEAKLSTLEIALRLGYNQSSSFCTAFKEWTGNTPSEYRELGTELQSSI